MTEILNKGIEPDIVLLLEGTYPYVVGGVASWVHQLILALPQYKFAGIFLGGRSEDYQGIRYELPENFVYLKTEYLFSGNMSGKPKATVISDALFNQFKEKYLSLLKITENNERDLRANLKSFLQLVLSHSELNYDHIIYSEQTWDYLCEIYKTDCPEASFIDYFWTLRNIHAPVWKLLLMLDGIPKSKLLHSISTGYAGLLGSMLQVQRNIPYVLTEHGIYTKERKIDLLQLQWQTISQQCDDRQLKTIQYMVGLWIRFFEKIAKICYLSSDTIISLFKAYQLRQIVDGAPEQLTKVIPNGALPFAEKKQDLNINDPIVALIGRVVPIKDIKTFIRAAAQVVQKKPQARFWVIGSLEEDARYATECMELTTILNLSDKVKFLGLQDIKKIMSQIDLIVLSSISEGMPLSVLEAFAAGIPVVTTDVGSCRELVEGNTDEDKILGSAGIVVGIANSQALADAILEMLNDVTRWRAAQQTALQRVERYYDQVKLVKEYSTIYQELLK